MLISSRHVHVVVRSFGDNYAKIIIYVKTIDFGGSTKRVTRQQRPFGRAEPRKTNRTYIKYDNSADRFRFTLAILSKHI